MIENLNALTLTDGQVLALHSLLELGAEHVRPGDAAVLQFVGAIGERAAQITAQRETAGGPAAPASKPAPRCGAQRAVGGLVESCTLTPGHTVAHSGETGAVMRSDAGETP